jgi:hypothetical protein
LSKVNYNTKLRTIMNFNRKIPFLKGNEYFCGPKPLETMKKLIQYVLVPGVFVSLMMACGPSKEEQAAAEQRMRDSIAAVEQARADSLIQVQQQAMADSLAIVQAVQDSMARAQAVADSIAAKKSKVKPKPKPNPNPSNPTEVKPGQGRG